MDVLIFGATGMVGQGVLRECMRDPEVNRIVTVGRTPVNEARVQDLVVPDLFDLRAIARDLTGLDACFFCLGVSSAGMSEEAYTRITYDLTMSVANMLAPLNPQMTFIYVSGAGTDSTEKGRSMWARVKGRTENELLRLPFRGAYMFRPGFIQPMHGIKSKTRLYSTLYTLTVPLLPLLRRMPRFFTTTERVGRAMLAVAKTAAPNQIVESDDINRLGS